MSETIKLDKRVIENHSKVQSGILNMARGNPNPYAVELNREMMNTLGGSSIEFEAVDSQELPDLELLLWGLQNAKAMLVYGSDEYLVGCLSVDLIAIEVINPLLQGNAVISVGLYSSSGLRKSAKVTVDISDASSAYEAVQVIFATIGRVMNLNRTNYVKGWSICPVVVAVADNRGVTTDISGEYAPKGWRFNNSFRIPLRGSELEQENSAVPENDLNNPIVKTEEKESNLMSNVKTNAVALVSKNKSAALSVAKIEAGRIAVKQVSKVVTPKLPIMVRGYADTAIGHLVLANLFNFAVTQFASGNKSAVLVADAMLEGAMLELLQSFNVEDLINDVVSKVDVTKLTLPVSEE